LFKIIPKENERTIAGGVADQSKHSAYIHGRANNDRKEFISVFFFVFTINCAPTQTGNPGISGMYSVKATSNKW
jgi:hypothetical protein